MRIVFTTRQFFLTTSYVDPSRGCWDIYRKLRRRQKHVSSWPRVASRLFVLRTGSQVSLSTQFMYARFRRNRLSGPLQLQILRSEWFYSQPAARIIWLYAHVADNNRAGLSEMKTWLMSLVVMLMFAAQRHRWGDLPHASSQDNMNTEIAIA